MDGVEGMVAFGGLISAIVVLSIMGAPWWGWILGILFGPILALVAYSMVS